MSTYEILSVIIQTIGVAAAIIAAIVYYAQLKRMNKSIDTAVDANSIATLSAVLSLEKTITDNRIRLSDASVAVANITKETNSNDAQTATLVFNEARENYLNSMDRLCACILRGQFPEEDYRKDYRNAINEIVSHSNYKDLMGTGTRYRNIIKLYEKWADQ